MYQSRVPSDPEYLRAIGQATFSFCYLEWQVIWVAQKLDPAFQISNTNELTAGRIAVEFKKAVISNTQTLDIAVYQRLESAYKSFFELVGMRNDLLHAHPFTSQDNAQRLGRYKNGENFEWTPNEIDAASERFDNLTSELNDLYYNHLN